jgi:hypothetical protein
MTFVRQNPWEDSVMLRNLTLCAGAMVTVLVFSSGAGACCGMRHFCCGGCASYGVYDASYCYGGYGYGGYGNNPFGGYGYGGYPYGGYGYGYNPYGGYGYGGYPGGGYGYGYNPGGLGGPASGLGVRPGVGVGGLGPRR